MFWCVNVNDGFTIEATEDITKASPFYVLPHEDGFDHVNEFMITYVHNQPSSGHGIAYDKKYGNYITLQPTSRYLDSIINICGENPGPLQLRYGVNEIHSRMHLISRTVEHFAPFAISSWTNSEEIFYIQCARRRLKKNGYICVKQIDSEGTKKYITACISNLREHNDKSIFMLFRLLPASIRETPAYFWSEVSSASMPKPSAPEETAASTKVDDEGTLEEKKTSEALEATVQETSFVEKNH